MKPKETFYKELKKLNLTEMQNISIQIIALELAKAEWLNGYETCEEITKKTLSILG